MPCPLLLLPASRLGTLGRAAAHCWVAFCFVSPFRDSGPKPCQYWWLLLTSVVCGAWPLSWCLPVPMAHAARSSVGQSPSSEFLVRPNAAQRHQTSVEADHWRSCLWPCWAGAPFGIIGTNCTCVTDKTEDSVLSASKTGQAHPYSRSQLSWHFSAGVGRLWRVARVQPADYFGTGHDLRMAFTF